MFNKISPEYAYRLYYLQAKQWLLSEYIARKLNRKETIHPDVLRVTIKVLRELSSLTADMLNDGKLPNFNSTAAVNEAKSEIEELVDEWDQLD